MNDQSNKFKFPLPKSLELNNEWHRLSVSLAYLSPISPRIQKYRTASLWFELDDTSLFPDKIGTGAYPARRGTVQHEVFEGSIHQRYNELNLNITVNCKSDAGKIEYPINYGLAVTLQVADDANLSLYSEIYDNLGSTVRTVG